MKKSRILKILTLVALILLAGMYYGNYRTKEKRTQSEVASLRASAKNAFEEMRLIYEQRLEILREIDPLMATQVQSRCVTLNLSTQEGVEQFDYFQNLVSEKLSVWLSSPASKKSTLALKLKAVEVSLIRKRAEFHRLAFDANEKMVLLHSPSEKLAVFKAEKILREMESKPLKQ